LPARSIRQKRAIRKLPDDQQELIKIKRKYDLSDNIYKHILKKRSEADIVKAANLPIYILLIRPRCGRWINRA
jgi:uncharacterized protein involved in exopolysaccharide biosynthesis